MGTIHEEVSDDEGTLLVHVCAVQRDHGLQIKALQDQIREFQEAMVAQTFERKAFASSLRSALCLSKELDVHKEEVQQELTRIKESLADHDQLAALVREPDRGLPCGLQVREMIQGMDTQFEMVKAMVAGVTGGFPELDAAEEHVRAVQTAELAVASCVAPSRQECRAVPERLPGTPFLVPAGSVRWWHSRGLSADVAHRCRGLGQAQTASEQRPISAQPAQGSEPQTDLAQRGQLEAPQRTPPAPTKTFVAPWGASTPRVSWGAPRVVCPLRPRPSPMPPVG